MSNTAPIAGIPSDVSAPPAPSTSPTNVGPSQSPATPIDDQADLRLVIEEDKAAGSYVYKTVDPVTGKVISQVPREELLKMRETPDYKPGSIVNARG
ncbi:MAG TPA: flagellar protein FlaG [Caulobacteraceae bacterium]|nr:flagellar protein FlaG [Caulobacteraceae bacterium]